MLITSAVVINIIVWLGFFTSFQKLQNCNAFTIITTITTTTSTTTACNKSSRHRLFCPSYLQQQKQQKQQVNQPILPFLRHNNNDNNNMASSTSTSSSLSSDYAARKSTLGFTDKETLAEYIISPNQSQNVVLLDVRSEEEIKVNGTYQPPSSTSTTTSGLVCLNIPCKSVEDVTNTVQELAPTVLPSNMDTPIIVYCTAGRRANRAQQTLTELGFTNVMNAGGYADLLDIKMP
jgi:rhodanese-related sulfurtransferase